MRILQPNYEKKVLERGHLFGRVILAGTLEWRGTLQIFCVKSTNLGGSSAYVNFLPLGPSCRGTQIILISSIYGMHRYYRYENFATNKWKKSRLKRDTFFKGYLSWNTWVKGHPSFLLCVCGCVWGGGCVCVCVKFWAAHPRISYIFEVPPPPIGHRP